MSTATSEIVATDEPIAERRTRVGLHEENVYVFAADKLAEANDNKIEKADGSQADGFRLYKVITDAVRNAEGELTDCKLIAFAYGQNQLSALGYFAQSKGYECELNDPKPRGAARGPRRRHPAVLPGSAGGLKHRPGTGGLGGGTAR